MVTDLITSPPAPLRMGGDEAGDEFGEELDLDLDEELDSEGFEEEDLAE